jgi:hypothetical protein
MLKRYFLNILFFASALNFLAIDMALACGDKHHRGCGHGRDYYYSRNLGYRSPSLRGYYHQGSLQPIRWGGGHQCNSGCNHGGSYGGYGNYGGYGQGYRHGFQDGMDYGLEAGTWGYGYGGYDSWSHYASNSLYTSPWWGYGGYGGGYGYDYSLEFGLDISWGTY